MADLRTTFEDDDHTDVRTYIQSGNVLFTSSAPRKDLEDRIERVLEKRFGVPLVTVVRSARQFGSVVESAPKVFGSRLATHHLDVLFLKAPLTSAKVMKVIELRDGVDEAWAGRGVVYFSRLTARRTQSRLNRIASTPEYQLMTIRSWSTTTKLAELLRD